MVRRLVPLSKDFEFDLLWEEKTHTRRVLLISKPTGLEPEYLEAYITDGEQMGLYQ